MRRLHFLFILFIFLSSLKILSADESVKTGRVERIEGNLLRAIEDYDQQGNCYRTEQLYWDDQGAHPRLLARSFSDSKGIVTLSKSYKYDSQERLIEEILYGSLTGESNRPIILQSNGLPIDNGVEKFVTRYSYSKLDNQTIERCETENGFVITGYRDFNDRQLITFKLTGEGKFIRLRNFFDYDFDGNLIKLIIDDGSSESPDCLQGVTERRITHITPSKNSKNRTTPLCVEENFWDFALQKEVLIKKIEHRLSEKDEVIERKESDAIGAIISYQKMSYDEKGNLIQCSDHDGNIYIMTYDDQGNMRTCSDGKSQKTLFYDAHHRIIRSEERDLDGTLFVSRHIYDDLNNRVIEIDTCGNETVHEFDHLGRLIKVTYPEVIDDKQGLVKPTTHFEYGIFDKPIAVTAPNNQKTVLHYNARGDCTALIYPDGTEERLSYNLDGSLASKKNSSGITAEFTRDFLGNVAMIKVLGPEQQLIHLQTAQFTPFRIVSTQDSNGNEVFHKYDSSGNLVSSVMQRENYFSQIDVDYDAQGQVQATHSNNGSDSLHSVNIRDEKSGVVETSLQDSSGAVLRKIFLEEKKNEASAIKTTLNTHYRNERGQSVLQKIATSPLGLITETIYDALGRIEKVVQKDIIGNTYSVQEMRYDVMGNKVRQIDQLTSVITPIETVWEYDQANRVTKLIEAYNTEQQKTTSYSYNEKGLLAAIVKPDGVLLQHEYDSLGRLEIYQASDLSFGYRYSYDHDGNIVQVDDLVHGTQTLRTFSSGHQLISETLGNGLTLTSHYDLQGRRTELILPDSSAIAYEYDALDLKKIERFSSNGKRLYSHLYTTFDLDGALKSEEMIFNLGKLTHQWDSKSRLLKIDSPYWSETIAESAYDLLNNSTEVEVSDSRGIVKCNYAYDTLNELQSESGVETHKYQNDALYHCREKDDKKRTIDAANQLTDDGERKYSYDLNGNLIGKSEGDRETQFFYDGLNRLTRVVCESKRCYEYIYDTFDRRLSKRILIWIESEKNWKLVDEERYIYDRDSDIGRVDKNGKIVELRILGLNNKGMENSVAFEIDDKIYCPIHDHRGSLSALIDGEGHVVECYRYSAYGYAHSYDGAGKNLELNKTISPWKFSGKRYDHETGFLFFGKRYYDPASARWITQDPLGFIEGINRYAYCCNSPICRIDSNGLFSLYNMCSSCYRCLEPYARSIYGKLCYVRDQIRCFSRYNHEYREHSKKILGDFISFFAGIHSEKAEIGSLGYAEADPKVRISLINGIMCLKQDAISIANKISEFHGNVTVHYTYRPTEGWTRDLMKCILLKLGYFSQTSFDLADHWRKLITEMGGTGKGGLIIHYAHSIGGTETALAKDLMTEEELRMIRVVTFGSASLIPNEGFESVINYVSVRDIVPMTDPVHYLDATYNPKSNVIFTGTYYGIPFIDHLFSGSSYTNIMLEFGRRFICSYSSKVVEVS